MSTTRTINLCGNSAGARAGRAACGPSGHGKETGARAGRPAAGVRPATRFCLAALLLALLVICLAPVQALAVNSGDRIINRAFLNTDSIAPVESSVTVTVSKDAPPPKLEFLKYAPLVAQAEQVRVSPTWYRTGSDASAPFAIMPAPLPLASSAPIDLGGTVPLVRTELFHQCEPIFVRLTDWGGNLNPAEIETAVITVSDPATGDVEVLRLTESGPNTGVFTGYIQSSGSVCKVNPAAGTYSGYLPVKDGSKISATFRNSDGTESISSVAVVDPFGIVFNSVTGQPIDGVAITLLDVRTGLPATVLGDDGTSAFDSTVTSGGHPTDSSNKTYDFPPGQFRFPFVYPGSYRFQVTPPPGYAAPSAKTDAQLQAAFPDQFAVTVGSRLEPFTVNPGPALHIDIPLDPLPASLWLQKGAGKSIASIGDFVPYQLDLLNNDPAATAISVTITDTLPLGFRYRKGSTTVGGKKGADPAISADGRTLTYTLPDLPPKGSASIRYVVEVAAGAVKGKAVNYATAHSYLTTSNTAQATVQVQSDFLSSQSLIMGRVERGPCNLDWDEGVEGIRIYLEDGTFVTSDQRGMFHFEGIRPGTHVVQLDLDSLPEGFQVYSCGENSRFAGRSFSQFVDTQGGTMWRADFRIGRADDAALYEKWSAERAAAALHRDQEAIQITEEQLASLETARKKAAAAAKEAKEEAEEETATDDWGAAPAPAAAGTEAESDAPVDEWADPQPEAAPIVKPQSPDGIALELRSTLDQAGVVFTPTVELSRTPLRTRTLEIELPQGLTYRPASATADGHAIAEPRISGRTLSFELEALKRQPRTAIRFAADFAADAPSAEYITRASVAYATEQKGSERRVYADNVLVRIKDQERDALPSIVVRPTFEVFEAKLSAQDQKMLDETVVTIKDFVKRGLMQVRQLLVIGHTDKTPIARRSRRVYRDNTALSEARAKSVALYLKEHLGLAPAQISASGKGESSPVASNRTAEGRALNRRVEVLILTEKVVERVTTRMTKDASGMQRAFEAAGASSGEGSGTGAAAAVSVAAAGRVAASHVATAGPAASAARGSIDGSGVPRISLPLSVFAGATGEANASVAATSEAEGGICTFPGTPLLSAAAPLPSAAAANPPAAEAAKEPAEEEPRLTTVGILSPADGATLPDAISAVRIVVESKLTAQLLVDGIEIPADRIGFTLKDDKSEKTLYSYIGVNFGAPGVHTIKLVGKDPFGNVRLEKTATITRIGAIASIRLLSAEGNVADGKTPVRLKLELTDAAGVRFHSPTELQIVEGNLKPLKKDSLFPAAPQEKVGVQVDADGVVLFQPVTAGGPYRVVLGSGKATVEADTYVQPKMRDWILVGLGEGTVGYNALAGHMENLRSSGTDENLYDEGRLAFYGKGSIQGKWLLTMAYDSAKSRSATGDGLFQTINPEAYYTLYGDASQQRYDAASTRKLYLKIEREQFYAMFGDFDTNLTVTELSRYSRRLNGAKAEWQGRNLEANVFGTTTDLAYTRDEIQGDGTSGLYHLSRKQIVANSEKITLQVRDRFRSEIIVTSRILSRFADYSIDYEAGTIFFKEPIHSRDEAFNPQFIVAEYETTSAGSNAITAGGRVGAKLFDNKVRSGFTYIHEGQVSGSGNSYGVDTAVKLPAGLLLKGEVAHTDTDFGGAGRHGNAYLGELQQQYRQFMGRIYYREQENGFGLGQQNGSETGTRKAGADGSYKLSDSLTLTGEAYRQYNLQTGAVQDIVEERTNFTNGTYGAHLGARYASDTLGNGSHQTSDQLTFGGSWLTLNKRLTLHADRDQSLGGNNNASYPTRTTFGADYKLTEKVTFMAQQEFTSGSGADTNTTRVGFQSTPWSGGAINSSMQRETNENGERIFALFGLKQSWKITDKWSVDGGLDRSQTVRNNRNYSFNVNVPPAAGSSEDFTAVSLGTSYTEKKWSSNNRVEYRTSTSEDKWGVVTAFVGEPTEGWGWSARLQLFDAKSVGNGSSINDDLRLGLVYRPRQTRWIILDRLDVIYNKQEATSSGQESRRLVNNLNANFKPGRKSEISLQYGAKYTLETIDNSKYSGYTDLIGVEGRYDFTKDWDLGIRGSLLHSWGPGQLSYSTGLSVGYNLMQNAWLSLGYNLLGFSDKDFSAADYTAQGPYLKFRFKFDQNSVKDAVKWINQ